MGPTTGVNKKNESSEEIRQDIEETRADMSETIDAIQAKVNPETIKAQVKENIVDEAVVRVEGFADQAVDIASDVGDRARDVGSSLLEIIQENPIPAAMVGIGLGWLVYSSQQSDSSSVRYRNSPYDYDERGYAYGPSGYRNRSNATGNYADYPGGDNSEGLGEKAANIAGTVQDKVGDVADTVRDSVSGATDAVRDKVGTLANRGQEGASHLGENSQHLSEAARRKARRAARRGEQTMEESPLIGGAIALALGAAVGFMLPQTRQEDELMGEASDRVKHEAQDLASDAVDRAQDVASTAIDSAKQAGKKAVQGGKEAAKAELQAGKEKVTAEARAATSDVKDKAKQKASQVQAR